MTFDPAQPTSEDFSLAITRQFDDFLVDVEDQLASLSPALGELSKLANIYLQGGKRLRPAFGYWGHVAYAGQPADPQALLRACAGFEMLHVGILMHDDVLDKSDSRRGLMSAHLALAKHHRDHDGAGDSTEFGTSGAVVLGDLMIGWANQMVYQSGLSLEQLRRALPMWQAVQTEVNAGQYLDIANQFGMLQDQPTRQSAELVLEVKTARYTVIRPLQFGAATGGASDEALSQLARFGSPIGRAFQLRDDLLGVFADSTTIGKPSGGDLIEGKRTVLLEIALQKSPDAERLRKLVGRELSDDELCEARELIQACGAVAEVEKLIDDCAVQAREALSQLPLTTEGRVALVELAEQCIDREF